MPAYVQQFWHKIPPFVRTDRKRMRIRRHSLRITHGATKSLHNRRLNHMTRCLLADRAANASHSVRIMMLAMPRTPASFLSSFRPARMTLLLNSFL
ncbi:hypothetical protein [Paenibacillus arenilitoris]|uniref:Uncharacterized protein n=1 Tax=Paenibacillus arenilitoris TaxID=2772299 RepID=A0A927H548_9BACL|nr:hypothetical protein [Paenibacillus arenilitoris]MBD2868565.1 hypothetical protein [Paenibacillus arenilitoris]